MHATLAVNDIEQRPDRPQEVAAREAIRLSFLIHDVSRLRRAAYDQFMKPLGITGAQWWVLAHLSRHDGMTQTQLAAWLDVGKASLGEVLAELERQGWVERHADLADRRTRRVLLTRDAQTLIRRMAVMEDEFNRQTLSDVDAGERAELMRTLQKIKQAIVQFKAGSEPLADSVAPDAGREGVHRVTAR